ncbi:MULTISPECIES: hypothetical protein [unclassified Mesorhizobium]|uniref:hypothetical protein n=1 Tax=unclassified Mesorhizobium TaxID=325217 RepID=UPI001091FC6C|nr:MULTISPECIES: hypothetical protein [unclassified Mesorhizobium]TGQ27676.1 hypothetical protein EN857_32865 [Mesorhizobium sp. M4B.F.Ca.ET.214.01.1.1]TGQ54895.1 hypothetical protein EN854_32590 [Mesorhizobium sp. M4B.F.Ca.ET.211.01.1.1]TGU28295.1 hypothetical protein EN793_32550 [Mesorhizobium sp. M4B.F.Ca.ET.150.01.1.1]
MVRRNKPKQSSGPELERFLQAAKGLHQSIVEPLISPQCDHYRSMQDLHEALLKTVREVTGKEAEFIRWNGTGPVQQSRNSL